MSLKLLSTTAQMDNLRNARIRRQTVMSRNMPGIIVSRLARKAHAITLSSIDLHMPISKLNVRLLEGLLYNVLSHYTGAPSDLSITTITPADDLVVYKIKCHAADYPKISGKQGTSMRQLKTLFAILGKASGARVDIILGGTERINEPQRGLASTAFDPEPIRQTIEAIIAILCLEPLPVTVQTTEEVTCYHVMPPIEIPLEAKEAIHYLVGLFGAKQDQKLYIDFR